MTDDVMRLGDGTQCDAWTAETRALEAFWQLNELVVNRPEILRVFARVVIVRAPDWDYADVRRRGCELALSAEICFCCCTAGRRLYWHHVIQVQHGGSNAPRNLVHICHRCHAAVHPWLDADREGERVVEDSGFRHIAGDGAGPIE